MQNLDINEMADKTEKRSLRILIVTHAPLSPKFGAAQMAINLGNAFEMEGHQVTLWSPYPIPPSVKRWNRWWYIRKKLNAFLQTNDSFDLIDCPPKLITSALVETGNVIARSVQPDLLYLLSNLRDSLGLSFKEIVYFPFQFIYTIYQVFWVLRGWILCNYIFCLGTHELVWMKGWFPQWKHKLHSYLNALSVEDQRILREVRENRKYKYSDSIRFIWIGRWANHKGTNSLIFFIKNWLKKRPEDIFTIAGCGYQVDVSKFLDDQALKQVRIIPRYERMQLFQLLCEHDIGLFTSHVEGWGLSLNEMLEAGLVVFATDAGGVLDLKCFFKESLYSFPPQSETILEKLNLYTFPERYYQEFTWEAIAKSYLKKIEVN